MSSSRLSPECSLSRGNQSIKPPSSRIPKFSSCKKQSVSGSPYLVKQCFINKPGTASRNVSVQRSMSNMESTICSPSANVSLRQQEEEDECMRLKNLIAVEQHRFICERIELQNAQKQIALLGSELESIKFENGKLKEELHKYQNDLGSKSETSVYEEPASVQYIISSEIQQLKEELDASQLEAQEHAEVFERTICEQNKEIDYLKIQLEAAKSETQEKSEAFNKTSQAQINEIVMLKSQLTEAQRANEGKNQSMATFAKLLTIRTDLISSMQTKEDLNSHQLESAYRLVNEKTEDWQKMLTAFLAKEEDLQNQREQVGLMKAELETCQTALENSDKRIKKLVEANGMLKLQFHKIMSCRDIKV